MKSITQEYDTFRIGVKLFVLVSLYSLSLARSQFRCNENEIARGCWRCCCLTLQNISWMLLP